MKVHPFTAVNGLSFGSTLEAVKEGLGLPLSDKVSRVGERELRYVNACYRFNSQGLLVEISVDASVVEFGSVSVSFKHLATYLKEQDISTFETVGFVVSPVHGVALDSSFPSWVTAFSRERLAQWPAVVPQ